LRLLIIQMTDAQDARDIDLNCRAFQFWDARIPLSKTSRQLSSNILLAGTAVAPSAEAQFQAQAFQGNIDGAKMVTHLQRAFLLNLMGGGFL
jgi:hypothetical protein